MALSTSAWTLAELDRLPDDGNKYELVDGALSVTPAPSPAAEDLLADAILEWSPAGAHETLHIDVAAFFEEALGTKSRQTVIDQPEAGTNRSALTERTERTNHSI